jgi:hypothetical protein
LRSSVIFGFFRAERAWFPPGWNRIGPRRKSTGEMPCGPARCADIRLDVRPIVVLLAVVNATMRLHFLCASPFAVGVDGYYYAVQVRALVETGQLYYPHPSLALYAIAPLAALVGPIAAVKVTAALAGAGLVVVAFAIGRRVGRGPLPGMLCAAWVATSPGAFYLSAEFVETELGLLVAGLAILAVLRALERGSTARTLVALTASLATITTHVLAGVMLCALIVPALLHARRISMLALAGVPVVLFCTALVLVRTDALALVVNAWTLEPSWTLPALATPRTARWFGAEPLQAVAIALAASAVLLRPQWRGAEPRSGETAVLWSAIGLCLFIGVPWLDVGDAQGLGFRLRIVAFFPASIALAAVGRLDVRRPRLFAVLGVVGMLVVRRPVYVDPVVATHPSVIEAARRVRDHVPTDAVVIVPDRHLMFMVTWASTVPARLQAASVPLDRRWRLLPGRHMTPQLRRALERALRRDSGSPVALHPDDPLALVLLHERDWQQVLAALSPYERERWRTTWPDS